MTAMLFPDMQLGAAIEASEAAFLRAILGDVTSPEFTAELSGGVAAWLEPGAPMNKVAGVGASPWDETIVASLERVEAAFRQRESPVQFEVSTLADPSWVEQLTRRGYILQGFEDIVGFDLSAPSTIGGGDAEIRTATPAEMPMWAALGSAGFAAPDGQGVQAPESFPSELIQRCMLRMSAVHGFAAYILERDGTPAATGAIYHGPEGVSHLCGASTLPEHRRRGAQTQLLQRRISDAREMGARLLVMTCQPGSKSQQNALRNGAVRLYSRATLVRSFDV